jgi:nitrite reductase/ring-hydroxylating ferredoxin subunit
MKDGHTLRENRRTQPLTEHRAFNNHEVVTEGWYPVCPARSLKTGAARSFKIGYQRVALYRGADGRVRALDAFCPHMGADLANGTVVGNEIQCYFHQWRYDESGACTGTRCGEAPPKGARVTAWPVEERYGFLWVFSAPVASHPLPVCPGLDGCEVDALHLGRVRLFAHHHAMMAGGIDLQHFASVHDLDVDFDLDVVDLTPGVAEWRLRGQLPARGWRSRLGRLATGGEVSYTLRVAGGSVAAITYGGDLRRRRRAADPPHSLGMHAARGGAERGGHLRSGAPPRRSRPRRHLGTDGCDRRAPPRPQGRRHQGVPQHAVQPEEPGPRRSLGGAVHPVRQPAGGLGLVAVGRRRGPAARAAGRRGAMSERSERKFQSLCSWVHP